MTHDEAIELIRTGQITSRDRNVIDGLLELLAQPPAAPTVDPDSYESVLTKNSDLQESVDWLMQRNHDLAKALLLFARGCVKFRTAVRPSDDIFKDFSVNVKEIIAAWKSLPSMSDLPPELVQTLKEIADSEKKSS